VVVVKVVVAVVLEVIENHVVSDILQVQEVQEFHKYQ
jgi:hypothetical protein